MVDGVIKNSSIREGYYHPEMRFAVGRIYNDRKKRFGDGTMITTSEIISGPNNDGIIQTRNSTYKLE